MNLDSTRSQRKKMSQEAGDDYSSSLGDLTMNSKPLINMLTILAEENLVHASVIVQSVEKHLDQVNLLLYSNTHKSVHLHIVIEYCWNDLNLKGAPNIFLFCFPKCG